MSVRPHWQNLSVLSRLQSTTIQAVAVSCIFFVLQLIMVQNHEMWRDELQAWLIARDSVSIIDLFKNMRYEGHPALWHLLLLPITRLFNEPEAMQIAHLIIATGSIYLVVRYSPFSLLNKMLLCMSYFLFYEYSQISRNYALGVFLSFLFCSIFPLRERYIIQLSIILFLLAQTSVFGTILAVAFALALITEKLSCLPNRKRHSFLSASELVAAVIFVAGIMLAVIQLKPPVDSGFAVGWFLGFDLERMRIPVRALIGSYLPIPILDINYWNSLALLQIQPIPKFGFAIVLTTVIAVVWFAAFFLNRPSAFLTYSLILGACLLFYYVKYPGSLRHHGFLFIGLIVSFWISPYCSSWSRNFELRLKSMQRITSTFFLLILVCQAVAGISAAILDYRFTFSQAKNAAEVISYNAGPNDLLVGTVDYAASAIAGYLDRKIYYAKADRMGTFIRWDNKRDAGRENTMPTINKYLDSGNKVFIIANRELNVRGPNIVVSLLLSSDVAVVGDERFFIYEISR